MKMSKHSQDEVMKVSLQLKYEKWNMSNEWILNTHNDVDVLTICGIMVYGVLNSKIKCIKNDMMRNVMAIQTVRNGKATILRIK